jgi:hypothetical protein
MLAYPAITSARGPWRAIRATMTGVIATLCDLGRAPVAPSRWLSPTRVAYPDICCGESEWREVTEVLTAFANQLALEAQTMAATPMKQDTA